MIALYHWTNTLISFLCKPEFNLKFFIWPQNFLSIELIETHVSMYTNKVDYS